ncbi:TetR/AcrR family transcriptional regulator [Streptomyces sp. NPDC059215]|uniref:TetR/AcrR family transcriptional regulator n=1 Tax=Streptomyces sp. NPDC059215 TaxID=3346772 RepID=UPI0036883C84
MSVADLMNSVGLTHGGFYKQFESKEALVGEAIAEAFADLSEVLSEFDASSENLGVARSSFIASYLSEDHQETPETGCPVAGFTADLGRGSYAVETQEIFADGVQRMADWLSQGDTDEGFVTLSTLVGAILMARATAGTELSEKILAAARRSQSAE